jgi:tetratricopeptide (TPR) repeat protein
VEASPRSQLTLRLFLGLLVATQLLQSQRLRGGPDTILKRADELADFYNWTAARPLYQQAEQGYRSQRDSEHALYARIGWLRATMETRSLPALSAELGHSLSVPFVRLNKRRQLRIWIAKGDVDAELDSALAQSDWEQALQIAKAVGDARWVNRSNGEIGFHRYVQGDHNEARKRVTQAAFAAHKAGDVAAEIRFLSAIGTGFALGGSNDEALIYLGRASDAAKQHTETGFPYMAVAGTTMALIGRGSLDAAYALAAQQLDQARRDSRWVKWTQAQLFLADIYIERGDKVEAIRVLNQTIDVAKKNGSRLLTDVYSKLAGQYRENGDLIRAERACHDAVVAAGESKDMYLAPSLLLMQANLQIALHRESDAELLLQRATDIVEGMLGRTTSTSLREGLLTTMGKVYTAQFELLAQQNDIAGAYGLVERVRGRIITELILSRPIIADLDRLDPKTQAQIMALKVDLVKATSERERRRLVDQLFFLDIKGWGENTSRPGRPFTPSRAPEVAIGQVQRTLRPNEVLLEYVLDDPHSHCLLIDKDHASIITLDGRKEIEDASQLLLANVREKKESRKEARRLGRLIKPPSLRAYRYVTVVPDGILHLVPFDALVRDDGAYWGAQQIISYAPSASTELLLRTRGHQSTPGTMAFLGIGGVNYDLSKDNNSNLESAAPPVLA